MNEHKTLGQTRKSKNDGNVLEPIGSTRADFALDAPQQKVALLLPVGFVQRLSHGAVPFQVLCEPMGTTI